MIETIKQIEMIKKNVNIILVDLNLEVKMVYGLKVGLVVEINGMQQDVHMEFTEDTLNMHKLEIVLIMVNQIQNLYIQIAFVEDRSFIKSQPKKEKMTVMINVTIILDSIK